MRNRKATGNSKQNNSRFTQKQIIMISAIAILVIAGIITTVVLLTRQSDDVVNVNDNGRILAEGNYREILNGLEEKVENGRFRTYMNTSWSFPDGKSASTNAIMGNSAANIYPMYFTVTLSDTGEVVYTSGVFPVGTEINELILDVPLEQYTR